MGVEEKVKIKVDASKFIGELKHSWRYIGYNENNYTHTPEGEELIARFGRLEDAPCYFRTHHMLCTGNLHSTYKWSSTKEYDSDGSKGKQYTALYGRYHHYYKMSKKSKEIFQAEYLAF
jgi:xylan 1,4-beta-xylosidase